MLSHSVPAAVYPIPAALLKPALSASFLPLPDTEASEAAGIYGGGVCIIGLFTLGSIPGL